ncbi:MAG: hypothetical protein SH848_13060 [Saprospiraceae bacterium]|nr:hypothetical protein [Saprospiraceae bacterium]MDZ4704856.1 hypothetical protein [Saprospiraceae bacterium]
MPMPPPNYEFINLSYLDQVAGGDLQTRATLLDLVAKEILDIIPQLSILYLGQAWGDIKDHVHRMKTTLAFAGNADMSTANSQIWKALVAMDAPEDIGSMIHALDANYRQVARELQTELHSMAED